MTQAPRTCCYSKRSPGARSWLLRIAKRSLTDTCGTSSATARCCSLTPRDPADQSVAHGVHLVPRLIGIRRAGDEQRRLVQRPEQDVRGRSQRLFGDGTFGDSVRKHSLDLPEVFFFMIRPPP